VLLKHYTETTGIRARELIEGSMELSLDDAAEKNLGQLLGPVAAEKQFHNIVRFMSGRDPADVTPEERDLPGKEKMILLSYEGIDAVRKIREVLGPTDPSKAPPGSIRREFGQTIMVNAAHASDSTASANRELNLVQIGHNSFASLIRNFSK
jgi:hypothetical protein